jgi:hypothetical protein
MATQKDAQRGPSEFFLVTENKIVQYGVSYPRGGNQQILTRENY